ncbi:hypothetical protein ACFSL6_17875 [Paenibacillus thailandensis]|uniref:Uncharacterized protein n=1 Tax=Paenibacillus thailandensis TaxID=393250 RepID=A0ABW5R214_9BACL
MANVDADRALQNLNNHIDSEPYFPAISDIIRNDPSQYTDHERLRQETIERLEEMDEWERRATPLPEHLKPKLLQRGDGG